MTRWTPRAVAPLSGKTSVGPDALLDALASERRLIEELVEIMRRQRNAVVHNDLPEVDDSVYSTHRVLRTLGEARRRRHSLTRALGRSDDPGIERLDRMLGERMTVPLRTARDELRTAALTLSHEVELNRHLLREALVAREDCLPTMSAAPGPELLPSGDSGS